ncbi:MAG: hypothetical protein AB7M05_01670 [Alphaproteobacteria bacterium]
MVGKLPVGKLASVGYLEVFHPFRRFLRKSWGWILVMWIGGELVTLIAAQFVSIEDAYLLSGFNFSCVVMIGLAMVWLGMLQRNVDGAGAAVPTTSRWDELELMVITLAVALVSSLALTLVHLYFPDLGDDLSLLLTLIALFALFGASKNLRITTGFPFWRSHRDLYRVAFGKNFFRIPAILFVACVPFFSVAIVLCVLSMFARNDGNLVPALLLNGAGQFAMALCVCVGMGSAFALLRHLQTGQG